MQAETYIHPTNGPVAENSIRHRKRDEPANDPVFRIRCAIRKSQNAQIRGK